MTDPECATCRLPAPLCICALVPRLQTRTRVTVIVPYRESRKPSNTGKLAARCLDRGSVQIKRGGPLPPPVVHPGELPLVLFPAPNARLITDFAASQQPIALIVPDGTWPQARAMQQVAPLRYHTCVTLPELGPSEYRLRDEPQPGGLATFEAIARSLRILEGDAGERLETAMLAVFRVMVERLLWFRGKLAAHEVSGGIPAAARAT